MDHPAPSPVPGTSGEVTALLIRMRGGGQPVADQLFGLIYDELRRIASRQMRGERTGHTLTTSDLVHEAYLRLVGLERIEWEGRAHFLGVAAAAMRRLLIDHARRRNAEKRGGPGEGAPLVETTLVLNHDGDALLDLDTALHRLESIQPRQARVVECRFFAGMSIDETADALGIARVTVKRDWAVARAWLHRELDR
jgi:RNA polymerase sigma factor (TIGR02999 family)